MVSITDLAKNYGSQTLFTGATVRFNPGCCYGIVGANGSGKSTLLRLLTGEEEASSGAIAIPKKAVVGVLKQDHFQYENVPILDVVMMGHEQLWAAMAAKEELLANTDVDFDADRYGELEDRIQQYDGYAMESRAGEILEGLSIATELHREPLSVLSGGFKLRVLLAQTLAAGPDLLLLDEPTNHLDILSIRWLEKFISEFRGCVLVVSHDHRFLNNICTHIVDVDYQLVTLYKGDYNEFQRQKVENRDRKESEIEKREKEIDDHKKFVERFKAKPTKARQAKSKAKQIDKIIIDDLPRTSRRYPRFKLVRCRHSGKVVVAARDISKAFGDNHVLANVDLQLERDDCLAILGPNGIGKSTLLKILVDDLKPDQGEVEWGYETHVGYFAQDHNELEGHEKETIQSWLWNWAPGENVGYVRGKLAEVLFKKDEVEKKLGALSGGEKARLIFSKIGIRKPNVLVLDEPTNHLDLEGIEALAKGLQEYDGSVVVVSHDRWFVSKVATRILEIRPDGIQDFKGTYDEYIERCGDDHLDEEATVRKARREKRK
jgi:ATPase subunit of ABC transporter with duplicated ATPase domains